MTNGRGIWRGLRRRLAVPYQLRLEKAVGDAESILDVGCGADSPLKLFRRPSYRVGVDAYAPAVEQSRSAGIHDDYRIADVSSIGELFGAGSFDAVVAFDVLEHLDEPGGLRLLAAMERIAAKRVVVFTPNGLVQQGAREGNPWQVHRSGWSAHRMRELGYTVTGAHGIRWLRREEAQLRWSPDRFWHLVSDLTEPLAKRRPSLAYHLIAVKDRQGSGPVSSG